MQNNKPTTEPREYYSYKLNLETEPNYNYTKTEPRLVILCY